MSTRQYSSYSHHKSRRHRKKKGYAVKVFTISLSAVILIGVFTAYKASEQLPEPGSIISEPAPQTLSVSQLPAPADPPKKAISLPRESSAVSQESQTSQSEQTSQKPASKIDKDQWNLILVNPWNPLPDNHSITLTNLKNDQAVDERCYPDLQAMIDACRAEGLSPVICSSYRTMEKQKRLFQKQIDQMLAAGLSQKDAEEEAAKAVAIPGTSEHQLGLAVDIVDLNNQALDETQEKTEVQKWLIAHCWEYGFILRYPNEKSKITGIMYEPWHYRYVGKEVAKEIHDRGICLEEYLG